MRAALSPTLLALGLFAGSAHAEPPRVVADIAPVHALVAQVMGDLGTPVLLVDRGGDPHDLQLRPSQAAALAEAGLLVRVGPELTPWLDRAIAGTGVAGEVLTLLEVDGVRLRTYDHDDDAEEAGHDAGPAEDTDGHHHEGVDPHAWLDPANATVWVAEIAARLASADPGNAERYVANADSARQALDALAAELRATLAPAEGVPLYTGHEAYGYFAEAFGLTLAGALADGDAAPPGAARIAELRARIAAGPPACVFAEPGTEALAEAAAEGTGARTGTLDPEGASVPPGPDHYAATLRALAAAIAACAAG